MRYTGVLAGVFLLSTWAWAAEPATRPASAQAVKVLVLPFGQITPDQTQTWIGWAIQQNLTAELSQTRGIQPLTPAAPPATDLLQAGRNAGAAFVVAGSYQVVEQNLRITGQILDVQSGTPAGGLRASGPLRELFQLEDTITTQVRVLLPRPAPPAPAPAASFRSAATELALTGPVPAWVGSQPWTGDRKRAAAEASAAMDRPTYSYYYGRYYYGDWCGYGCWNWWGYGCWSNFSCAPATMYWNP